MICGSGTLTARPLTFIPATASERRDGTMGGGTRLFLRMKATIREHPGWDDAQVAGACGGHPVFDAQLARTARGDVAADASIPDDVTEVRWGGPDAPY